MITITTILLVALILAIGAVAVLLLRKPRRSPAWPEPAEHPRVLPPQPPGPQYQWEVQQYDAGLSRERWTEEEPGTWVKRIDPQYLFVDAYTDVEDARTRMEALAAEARDPTVFRIIGVIAGTRTAGVHALTAAAWRNAPARPPAPAPTPRRKDTPVAHPATSPAEQSLYQQIGGEVTLSAVIRGFYRRVLDDNRVGPRFAHTDMGEMVQHQARAFGILTGGPNPKRMTVPQIHEWVREAHSGFGITNDEFNIVAGHLVAELESVGAPQFIPPLAAAFESFRGDVVTVEVPIPAGVG